MTGTFQFAKTLGADVHTFVYTHTKVENDRNILYCCSPYIFVYTGFYHWMFFVLFFCMVDVVAFLCFIDTR